MTDSALVAVETPHPLKQWLNGDKDTNSRLLAFIAWQQANGGLWYQPDLAQWRDELLARQIELPDGSQRRMSPATVAAYLGTVRGIYNKLLISNDVRDMLWSMTDPDLPPERRAVYVNEMLARLQNAVHPTAASVKLTKIQDVEDSKHLRLTPSQAKALIAAPGMATMAGIRDTALIALLLCTGIREDELCALDVGDLRQHLGGELALRVRHGKGDKQRLIPYGELDWCLILVDTWMKNAGIRDVAVFRGLTKGQRVRSGRLTTRSVRRIVLAYPVIISGRAVQVHPHDCRRTYARLMYESGVDLLAIQQNLGHEKTETTEGYIGKLDGKTRRARAFIEFEAAQLPLV